MSDRATQAERILSLLRSKSVVSLPEILDLRIASYTRRISELREQGYNIQCLKERQNDGTLHTQYRLIEQQEMFTEIPCIERMTPSEHGMWRVRPAPTSLGRSCLPQKG